MPDVGRMKQAPNKTRVLVVDDDLAVCDALKFALELEGFCVETCNSGADLLAGTPSADCLVLDYKMPGMDGLAVLAALTARQVDIPTILITAPLTQSIVDAARRAGVFCVLEKPLSDGVLLENIRHAARV